MHCEINGGGLRVELFYDVTTGSDKLLNVRNKKVGDLRLVEVLRKIIVLFNKKVVNQAIGDSRW